MQIDTTQEEEEQMMLHDEFPLSSGPSNTGKRPDDFFALPEKEAKIKVVHGKLFKKGWLLLIKYVIF